MLCEEAAAAVDPPAAAAAANDEVFCNTLVIDAERLLGVVAPVEVFFFQKANLLRGSAEEGEAVVIDEMDVDVEDELLVAAADNDDDDDDDDDDVADD